MIQRTLRIAALLLVLGVLAAGCSKTIVVQRYPDFASDQLTTVAVLGTLDESGQPRAPVVVTEAVTAQLKRNGTYQVVPRGALQQLIGPVPPPPDQTSIDAALAALRRTGSAQALLVTRIIEFGAATAQRSHIEADHYPSYGWYWYHRRGYARHHYPPYYYRPSYTVYYTTVHQGFVRLAARLVDVATGEDLYATPAPVVATVASEGNPPELTPGACREEAARIAARRLIDQIAVVRRETKLKPNDALRLLRSGPDGAGEEADEFSLDLPTLLARVALTPVCHRNTFTLRLCGDEGDDKDTPLAEQTFTWDRKQETMDFTFDLSALAPGKYRLAFLHNGKEAFDQNFRLRPAREREKEGESKELPPPPKADK